MIKLVALDVDKTVTEPDGSIEESTLSSIRKAWSNGVEIAVVSARPPQGVDLVADLLAVDLHRIAYLGAVVQTSDLTELRRLTIDLEVSREIAGFADKQGISLTLSIDDVEYQTQSQARPSMTPRQVIDSAKRVLEQGRSPTIIGVTGDEPSSQIYQYCLNNLRSQVHVVRHVNSGGVNLSSLIVHPNAEKGKGLQVLCDRLSISMNEVMAIGDSESDVTMFRVSGTSVAVLNSDMNAAIGAQIVAPYSFGQGVKWAIEEVVLKAGG